MAKSIPKLGRRSTESAWISRGSHALSDTARQQLALSVGLSAPADDIRLTEMIAKVQHHLGAYPGSIQVIDNAPRAADYVTEFRNLKQHADALASALRSSNARILETLDADLETDHSISLEAVGAAIASLRASSSRMITVFGAEADRGGRPKQLALGLLIDSLRKIFKAYHRGSKGRAGRTNAAKAPRQNVELQFLRTALADAGIKIDGRKLGKLLIARRQGKKPRA